MTPVPPRLPAPERRGELIASSYLIGDILGVGGMGVVYSAVQRSLDRLVAVKVPRPELIDDLEVRGRLRSEAFAGAAVNHPNVVHVLDFGTDGGVPFVVMEYVAGPRLSQLLFEYGPMPVSTAVSLARQVLAGLEDAHANGIVHADVKCDNVLVETQREGSMLPRLIDFGIARFIDVPVPEPGEPMVTGTAEYLPPEVILGAPPTFAADVYAVGVMLYELVTGATPFSGGTSTQVMTRRLEDDAIPMTLRCPERDIPRAFDSIVMRALAREPGDRFVDACALGTALDDITHALPPVPSSRSRSETTPIFSTEAPTAAMSARTTPLKPRARPCPTGAENAIVVACLDRARELVDRHMLAAAITELETGIVRLTLLPESTQVWRLQLTLAALYDGIGERARARGLVGEAREGAARSRSETGCERADRLATRLGRRKSRSRPPAW